MKVRSVPKTRHVDQSPPTGLVLDVIPFRAIRVCPTGKIIGRGLAADGRLCRVTAHMSDRPGSLAKLTRVIAEAGASVQQVQHDRNFGPADVGRVNISCTLETRDFEHVREVDEAMRGAGIEFGVG